MHHRFLDHGLNSLLKLSVHRLRGDIFRHLVNGLLRRKCKSVHVREYRPTKGSLAGLTRSLSRRLSASARDVYTRQRIALQSVTFCHRMVGWFPRGRCPRGVRSPEAIRNDADCLINQLTSRWGLWLSDCRSVHDPFQDQQRFDGEHIFLAAAECRPPSEACVCGFSRFEDPVHAGRDCLMPLGTHRRQARCTVVRRDVRSTIYIFHRPRMRASSDGSSSSGRPPSSNLRPS